MKTPDPKVASLVESLLNEAPSPGVSPAAAALEQDLKRLTSGNSTIQNIRTLPGDDGVWFDVIQPHSTSPYVIYRSTKSGLYVPYELTGDDKIDEVSLRDLKSLAKAVVVVIDHAKRNN